MKAECGTNGDCTVTSRSAYHSLCHSHLFYFELNEWPDTLFQLKIWPGCLKLRLRLYEMHIIFMMIFQEVSQWGSNKMEVCGGRSQWIVIVVMMKEEMKQKNVLGERAPSRNQYRNKYLLLRWANTSQETALLYVQSVITCCDYSLLSKVVCHTLIPHDNWEVQIMTHGLFYTLSSL